MLNAGNVIGNSGQPAKKLQSHHQRNNTVSGSMSSNFPSDREIEDFQC